MIIGELRNNVDKIWKTSWIGGISNSLEGIIENESSFLLMELRS